MIVAVDHVKRRTAEWVSGEIEEVVAFEEGK